MINEWLYLCYLHFLSSEPFTLFVFWLTVIVLAFSMWINVLLCTRNGIVFYFSYFYLSLRSLLLHITLTVVFNQLLGLLHRSYTGGPLFLPQTISDPVPRPSHGLPWLPEEWLPSFPLAIPGKYLLLSIVIGSYLRFDSMSVCPGPKPVGSQQEA